MQLCLGALYHDRDPERVRRSWSERLGKLGEARLALEVAAESGGAVRVHIRPRLFQRVPNLRLGLLARMALGPEREERAELWLLKPGDAEPGALRLAGCGWNECLLAISQPRLHQIRLWSPLVCPGPVRQELRAMGAALGLELRVTDAWALMAIPRAKPQPPQPPPPWKGNYGW